MGLFFGLLLLILNSADVVFTFYFVKKVGLGAESNPLIRGLMTVLGDLWVIPKILIGIYGAYLCVFYWERIRTSFAYYAILGVVMVYSFLTIYHLICLGSLL